MAMRKRRKSRLSSASKRTARWRGKYSVDAVTKRAKKLLPIMYPQLETALVDWDKLEQYLFPKFEELGITGVEVDYYLSWAKRKGQIGLVFNENTREAEFALLRSEFLQRGLNGDNLDALEPTVDKWIEEMRYVCPIGEVLQNNGWEDGVLTPWVSVGSPSAEVTTEVIRSGSYALKIFEGGNYVYQTVSPSVKGSCLKKLECYVYYISETWYPSLTMCAVYEDDTMNCTSVDPPPFDTWLLLDLLPLIDPTKKIKRINLILTGLAGRYAYVDDSSLFC